MKKSGKDAFAVFWKGSHVLLLVRMKTCKPI